MIELTINLKPCAKARPRVTRWGCYMPKAYNLWRAAFVAEVKRQWDQPPIDGAINVNIGFFCTSHRPDVDNSAGACLDALQDAGVFANDRAVKRLVAHIYEGKAYKEPYIQIRITPFLLD